MRDVLYGRYGYGFKLLAQGIFALVCLFIAAPALNAQALYGTLVGNVTDPSGAAIPGAQVTALDLGTGLERRGSTGGRGEYALSNLPVGTYSVAISSSGFRESVTRGVVVGTDQTIRVDVSLEVGAVTETIEVQADTVVLQTDRSDVRAQITASTMEALPVPPNRSYEYLLRILPGVTPGQIGANIGANPSRPQTFNVNGLPGATRSTRIDGAAQVNVWQPSAVAYIPSMEAIQTVTTTTSSFDAEAGGAGGAAINLTMKSGTNEIHGSLFETHNNENIMAKPVLLPGGRKNPPVVFNQFGGSIGGPIVKNRLFYFFSFDGTLSRTRRSDLFTVPTLAQKAGDLSESLNPIYNPFTGSIETSNREAFSNNQVPKDLFDPAMTKMMGLLPAPNQPGQSSNYFTSYPYNRTSYVYDAKVNYNPSDNLSVYGRLGVLDLDALIGEVFRECCGAGGPNTGDPGNTGARTISTTFAGTYVFNPNLIFDTSVGYTTMDKRIELFDRDKALGREFLGIPGTNGTRPFENGWPQFIVGGLFGGATGYTNFGTCCPWMPAYHTDPQFNYVANLSVIKGGHQFRFGFEFLTQGLDHQQAETTFGGARLAAQGAFEFNGNTTTRAGGPSANRLNQMAAMLLGTTSTLGKTLQVPDRMTERQNAFGWFFRDQWQVTDRLTVNLGIRGDYYPFLKRKDRGIERYDFDTNEMLLCGVGSVPKNCGLSAESTFGPRIGIAYRVTPTFVVRTGYSLAADPTPLLYRMRGNYPDLILSILTSGADTPNARIPVGLVKDGIKPIVVPDYGNGRLPLPVTVQIGTVREDFDRGYIQSWNFTLEKQLSTSMLGSVGYVASRSNGTNQALDSNAGLIGCGSSCLPLNIKFGRLAAVQTIQFTNNSHFDSLQLRLQKSFATGYQFGVSYTFAKHIGINNGFNHPAYAHLWRGALTGNPPHSFVFNGSAELPFGRGKLFSENRVASAILGGWEVAGIFSAVSGEYFGVSASGASLNATRGPTQRADLIKDEVEILGGTGRGQPYFDPLAFAPVTTARLGTAGINTMLGPTAVNLDARISRNIAITESVRLQLSVDAFNLTNTPHWSTPGTNVSDMQLNADGTVRSLNGYSEITSVRNSGREAGDQRELKLGLRLTF